MFAPVDDTCDFFGLLAVFAEDAEFVFAMLTVPDGELSAEEHRNAHFAGIRGDGILSHGDPDSFTAFAEEGIQAQNWGGLFGIFFGRPVLSRKADKRPRHITIESATRKRID
jgi:hypothetical protein